MTRRAEIFHVFTVVWGSAFIDLFLDVCVPNQLSHGNLAALPQGSRYRIFTEAEDVPRLTDSPALEALRAVLPVDVVAVSMTGVDGNRYKRMTACHSHAAGDAAEAEAALIFLAPDHVLAESTLAALIRLHASGKRAVLSTGVRLSREGFLAERGDAGGRSLPPRELVRIAMRHLHPATVSLMVDGTATNTVPTSVYWPVRTGGEIAGLLVRSFHLHPFLIDPVRRHQLPTGTIDGHYVMECCPDLRDVYVAADSDELVVFELSPAERTIGNDARSQGVSMLRLAAVAAGCNPFQRSHWEHIIRLHAGDVDEAWTDAENASRRLARDLERYRPYELVLVRTYKTLKRLTRRRKAYAREVRRARQGADRLAHRLMTVARRRSDRAVRFCREVIRQSPTVKQIRRPVKLMLHRAAKASKLGLKRLRRRVRMA